MEKEPFLYEGELFSGLEDLVFHNEPTQTYELADEKGTAYTEYLEARDVGSLLYHSGYKTLLKWSQKEVARTTYTRVNFKCRSDKDKTKEQELSREMEDAKSFLDRLTFWVEEAANVPKPV